MWKEEAKEGRDLPQDKDALRLFIEEVELITKSERILTRIDAVVRKLDLPDCDLQKVSLKLRTALEQDLPYQDLTKNV